MYVSGALLGAALNGDPFWSLAVLIIGVCGGHRPEDPQTETPALLLLRAEFDYIENLCNRALFSCQEKNVDGNGFLCRAPEVAPQSHHPRLLCGPPVRVPRSSFSTQGRGKAPPISSDRNSRILFHSSVGITELSVLCSVQFYSAASFLFCNPRASAMLTTWISPPHWISTSQRSVAASAAEAPFSMAP